MAEGPLTKTYQRLLDQYAAALTYWPVDRDFNVMVEKDFDRDLLAAWIRAHGLGMVDIYANNQTNVLHVIVRKQK